MSSSIRLIGGGEGIVGAGSKVGGEEDSSVMAFVGV
jgi:hypothetical protein